jgi:hypothetical protein
VGGQGEKGGVVLTNTCARCAATAEHSPSSFRSIQMIRKEEERRRKEGRKKRIGSKKQRENKKNNYLAKNVEKQKYLYIGKM